MNHIFISFFLISTILEFLISHYLEYIDWLHRKNHAYDIPLDLKQHFNIELLNKTKSYEDDKYYFWCFSSVVSLVLNLVLVFSGFYSFLFEFIHNGVLNIYLCMIIFFVLIGIPESIVMLPFSIYREFIIEKKYSFSKMTVKLFIADLFKNLVVSFFITVPLILAAIYVICNIKMWWLWISCIFFGFSLLLSFIYPVFIAPLFNKFTPMEDGDLKERLEKLLKKAGFKTNGMFIMDASKRSGHSNAYFTGFGKNKRIVLYDTLISQLTDEEIEAVLAHELGHCKKHHILKRMCFTVPEIFVAFFVLSIAVKIPGLYADYGFDLNSPVDVKFHLLGMFLVSLTFGNFSILLSPVGNFFSRKDEFEADRFSKEMCGTGQDLINALIKLNKENLSEITVPKIYSVFNYSHPPLLERIDELKENK